MTSDVMPLRQLVFSSKRACRAMDDRGQSDEELMRALDDPVSLALALRSARLTAEEILRLADAIPPRDFIPANLNDAETVRIIARN